MQTYYESNGADQNTHPDVIMQHLLQHCTATYKEMHKITRNYNKKTNLTK